MAIAPLLPSSPGLNVFLDAGDAITTECANARTSHSPAEHANTCANPQDIERSTSNYTAPTSVDSDSDDTESSNEEQVLLISATAHHPPSISSVRLAHLPAAEIIARARVARRHARLTVRSAISRRPASQHFSSFTRLADQNELSPESDYSTLTSSALQSKTAFDVPHNEAEYGQEADGDLDDGSVSSGRTLVMVTESRCSSPNGSYVRTQNDHSSRERESISPMMLDPICHCSRRTIPPPADIDWASLGITSPPIADVPFPCSQCKEVWMHHRSGCNPMSGIPFITETMEDDILCFVCWFRLRDDEKDEYEAVIRERYTES